MVSLGVFLWGCGCLLACLLVVLACRLGSRDRGLDMLGGSLEGESVHGRRSVMVPLGIKMKSIMIQEIDMKVREQVLHTFGAEINVPCGCLRYMHYVPPRGDC